MWSRREKARNDSPHLPLPEQCGESCRREAALILFDVAGLGTVLSRKGANISESPDRHDHESRRLVL